MAWLGTTLCQYHGFWLHSQLLKRVVSFQKHFQSHDEDIIIATKPKSGTTWLKALIFTIVNRTRYAPFSTSPLLISIPHELVPFFEFNLYEKAPDQLPDLSSIPSPRLFSTHIPYSVLPHTVKNSGSRIVYCCRNPKDIVVSYWYFAASFLNKQQSASDVALQRPIEELLDCFCRGVEAWGPFWDHILEYWRESLKRPNKVLFLTYEDLKKDTPFYVKKLAEFIGFPFSLEEERQGAVEEICNFCSLSSLKNLEVNQSGQLSPHFENKSYFRKGEVGDWVNHLTPSMVERINNVMQEKFADSGFTFKDSTLNS